MRRQILNIVLLVAAVVIAGASVFLAISHAGGVTGIQWTQIGPAPLEINANQNFQGNGPDSGQVVDVAIDPRGSTDQVIYVATQDGGVWQSSDGGSTWRTTTDALTSLSMGAVALDAGNASVVYAGTGSTASNSFFKGIGVYKSTDLGGTWTLTPGSSALSGKGITRMVSPSANNLLVGTHPGFFGGSGVGNGVFLSTDGGGTYTQKLSGQISDLHLDTTAANTVLAAVDSTGIFRSTDGGATWGPNLWTASNGSPLSVAGFVPGFISFSQSTKPNNQTIYASVQETAGGAPNWGLFVSTDDGATWSQAAANNNPSNNCGQCGYDQTIGVEPNDAATVYVGFVDMWKSTDSGANFSEIGHGQVHNDHHALVFSPHVPGSGSTTFYDGQDGGIALSPDGGGSFTAINGPNPGPGKAIATNLFRSIDIGRGSSTNNKFSYGGMQDTGTAEFTSSDTPTTWHLHLDGDGAGTAVDPCDPTHAVGMDDACPIFSTSSGSSWGFAGLPAGNSQTPGFSFGRTLVFDQLCSSGTDNTVYASGIKSANPPIGGQGCIGQGSSTFFLFRSTDGGKNYSTIASGFAKQISAIATAKIDPNTVWLGLNDGTLQVSTDATVASPTFAAPAAQPPQAGIQPVTDVAMDPTNTQVVVVTYAGFCGASCNNKPNKHIYMTIDGGATWADITGTNGGSSNLPDLPVHAVVIDDKVNPHAIIVSNDAGVLQSGDTGKTWQVLGLGMPTVDVVSLALDNSASPELLRAGTFGRSVFELGAPTGPLLSINTTRDFGIVCPGGKPTTLLQLFNLGVSDLTITNIKLISGSSDFSISGPALTATIKAGEEADWTIQLAVTPSSTNPENAVFEIDSNDGFNPVQQVTYVATIGQPKAGTVIANGGNFGNVCAGSFADLNLTVANSGSCNLDLSGLLFVPALADFKAPTASFPTAIHAGDSLAIPIRFQPAANTSGPESTTISVLSDDPGASPMVSVTGNAPPGQIAVTGSGMFGNVCAGTNAQQTITIGNVGPCNLKVGALSITVGSNPASGACTDFTIQNSPFPNVLSHDSNLPITILFTPQSGGTKTCFLQIPSDDPTNPLVTVTLTASTPAVSIDVPPDQGFPATVVQTVGACSSKALFPISNKGSCPLTITDVSIGTPGSNPTDFSLAGLPSLANPVQSGHTLGDGNLNVVFGPAGPNISRTRTGTLSVTYKSDPITPATTTVTRNFCGEAVRTGARVLVTAGGAPLTTGMVTKIQLNRLGSNRKSISVDNLNTPPLRTVAQTAPCAPFQYHAEWGATGDATPQLTTGDYQVTVSAIVAGKKVSKTVSFTLGTCTFNQNVVVNF